MRKGAGILVTPYFSAVLPSLSHTLCHTIPSILIASCQVSLSLSLSIDTDRITKFFPLNSLYACLRYLFSFLQGIHHEAQKSTSTYLPRNEDNANFSPLGCGKLISGTRLWRCNACAKDSAVAKRKSAKAVNKNLFLIRNLVF